MKLYNSLSRTVEKIEPVNPPHITMYSCGPTVYSYVHIGNLRTYVNSDMLKRSLTYCGYDVKHVMNITDVGHLTGDDDTGEDKLEKGARVHGTSISELADTFTRHFFESIEAVHIMKPDIFSKATEHIDEMIQLVQTLQEKGFTYETDQAIYFDTSKDPHYGRFSKQSLDEKKQQARNEVHTDPQKKHPADFALWFKQKGRFEKHIMHWDSPWGSGFPGWHIECSAMSMRYLGKTIDIHTGGIDLAPVHHENEIAQSECAEGKPFVKYWFHSEFLMVNGEKMSKSKGNLYTVDDIKKKGFDPLALRYLFLQTHYRQPLNFTWESLESAQNALFKLKDMVTQLRNQNKRSLLSTDKLSIQDSLHVEFKNHISQDIQMPQALAHVWKVVKSTIPSEDKVDLILSFDEVLGLALSEQKEEGKKDITVPQEIIDLAEQRLNARSEKDFSQADKIRDELLKKGYTVKDTNQGYTIAKSTQSSLDF